MSKNFWEKIKENPVLLMFSCGLIIMALIFAVPILKRNNNWTWLLILLCPLAHFFMMRKHGQHDHSHEHQVIDKQDKQSQVTYKCSVCGLEYKEEKWASQCHDWCSKHKSCNLEITKHAIK